MLKKGALTGLTLTNGTPVKAGDTLVDDNGDLWDANRFLQVVPKGDGRAMPLADFIRKNPGAEVYLENDCKPATNSDQKPLDIMEPDPELEKANKVLDDVKALRKENENALVRIATLEAENKRLRELNEAAAAKIAETIAHVEAAKAEVNEVRDQLERAAEPMTDQELADALRARGYEVTATKTIKIEL